MDGAYEALIIEAAEQLQGVDDSLTDEDAVSLSIMLSFAPLLAVGGVKAAKLALSKMKGVLRVVKTQPGSNLNPHTNTLTSADFPKIGPVISQKQNRHIQGRQEFRGGGTLSSRADAQKVLDAYHNGTAEILGSNNQGFPIVRFDGVTGMNNNVKYGIENQPTNVFIVKGTASPSIVPTNPNWEP
jgi:hypothetical protein